MAEKEAASTVVLDECEMNKFSEDSTGTGGRVHELTLPVDTSQRFSSPQTHSNEQDSDLEMNLQEENIVGPSDGSRQDEDEPVHPVSEFRSEAEVGGQCHVTFLEPIREEGEDADDDDDSGRTNQPIQNPENKDHTVVTVEESDLLCRTCGPDEETDEEIPEPDNLLVKLGCDCRGSLRRMHRKCIIEWYGPRMYRQNNYKCELCNELLDGRIESIVYRAFVGQDSGGDILFRVLGSGRALRRMRRTRRSRSAYVGAAPPTDGNARPASHQIQILEITHPGSRWAQDRPNDRSLLGSTRMCVVVFIIIVLIGFGVAHIGK